MLLKLFILATAYFKLNNTEIAKHKTQSELFEPVFLMAAQIGIHFYILNNGHQCEGRINGPVLCKDTLQN